MMHPPAARPGRSFRGEGSPVTDAIVRPGQAADFDQLQAECLELGEQPGVIRRR